ncbi:protein-glutamine gamma-glutamyltransferase [Paenibacillus zeisoli]|uniref:Protein-glutamine gamma-glutamyltransferase n=1 Tax=Paenibacillus zeisoli TaxID=2496267 RepID=A0A433XNL6_9BACL|nr:protein-glutamine gamma-glutamyltransferase [Paenibacillus zeisoli]RUT35667.1 protein-glutamine gamma-glutamyltransferase [Paenibacillus zeisoli]
MILIDDHTSNEQISKLPLSELERAIVLQKEKSSFTYRYPSLDSLRFELLVRQEITSAARELNSSGVKFAKFSSSRCNEAFWIRESSGGFRLKSGVKPSDAINDIYRNGPLYAFECGTAMVIVWYKAVIESISPDSFDIYFNHLFLYDGEHDPNLVLQVSDKGKEAFPGDVLYFENPDVAPEKNEWQGENVVLLEPGLYYGHGIGIKSAETIIAALNRNRKPNSQTSAFLTDYVVNPDFEFLRKFQSRPVAARVGMLSLQVWA